jgi:hypothetical protein
MSSWASQALASEGTDERNAHKPEEAHKGKGAEFFKDPPSIPENKAVLTHLNPYLYAARARVLEQHRKASGQRESGTLGGNVYRMIIKVDERISQRPQGLRLRREDKIRRQRADKACQSRYHSFTE